MVELMLATVARNPGNAGFVHTIGLGIELWADDPDQSMRLLSLAAILDGGSFTETACTGGVGLQVLRE
ncbi:MAG: hypothetical protein AAF416_12300 [Pseudomonadota bacterium]